MGIDSDPFPEVGEAAANVITSDFQNLSLTELEEVNVQMHVANQTNIKKNARGPPVIEQGFSHQKEHSDEESLDDDSLEAAVMQRMCPRCRLSYKWLKGLPTDGKQYYRDVQRRPKSTNAYNKRPYPASDRQRPPVVEPVGTETTHGFRVDEATCSNNQAEYEALIMGLEILIGLQFQIVNITHVPRFLNIRANDVAQKASNFKRKDNSQRDISQTTYQKLIQPLNKRNMVLEANHNDLQEQYWRHPIMQYLAGPSLKASRKVKL
ncbi:uncharacterized protein LOC114277118 [Camellia sinensis]|uniref:uncharacterized protein LOC114277118 n=1 Tax=Camellia sinensis TaxID=4442 RepID=UPI0010362469|nr:uncharacterized protein LOC114277118 [Camellia sinensis]